MVKLTDAFGIEIKPGSKILVMYCGMLQKAFVSELAYRFTDWNEGDDCWVVTVHLTELDSAAKAPYILDAWEDYKNPGTCVLTNSYVLLGD